MRLFAALALILAAGCASVPPRPAPEPAPPSLPEPADASAIEAPPQEPPATPAAPPRATIAPRTRVAVLFEGGTASAAAVAAQIASLLPADRYRVATIAIPEDAATLAPLTPPPAAIVAVGLRAVETARAQLPGTPVVFTQVFAYEKALGAGGKIWGVHSLPPLELQLKKWQAVDPTLRQVALILSDSHPSLVQEVAKAADAVGAGLRVEISSSDRETLYLFKRLASEVDGLWLMPDNRVLSPGVLRELLSYASSHGVGVLAFNDSLLSWGALLSAGSLPDDVAETVRAVLDKVVSGQTQDLPAMTPLSALTLRINPSVAMLLGLPPVVEPQWVAREPD